MQRTDLLERLRATPTWDVVVIGGGATGLGIALDATTRGYRTLLLEAHDFAKGTSSRSTKLVHGGVRYLAQGNIGLVREALRERGLLRQNAPHLVHELAFLVPAYSWSALPFYGAGLTLYDLMAGKLGLGKTELLSHGAALRAAPTLEPRGLWGGVRYFDGQFDDARLAITLLRTVLDKGGLALNYAPVTGFIKEGAQIRGVTARDSETGEELRVRAAVVVNATGVYADTLRHLDEPAAPAMLTPSQGVHLVVDRSFLPGDTAIMIPKTDDGRVLFAVPWHDHVVLGTTDTPVERTSFEPRALPEEIGFILAHAQRYLARGPEAGDVRSVYAGLRPLVKRKGGAATAAISRDHTLVVARSGLVTITGGKWTTYRHMAEDAVNRAATVAALPARPAVTAALHLRGWLEGPGDAQLAVYGADAPALRTVMAEQPGWDRPLHLDLPYCVAEVIWAARHELARTVEDVLARRTRALLLNARASRAAAPAVAALLAQVHGHDAQWQAAQVAAFDQLAAGYVLS